MFNRCEFIGHLGADPEVRRMGSGDPVVSIRLAVSESWRDKQTGERKERTEWIPVVVFNENIAKVAEQYLRKGSKVFVSGQWQTRKWTDQQGADRYSTEVVLQKFRGELVLLDAKGAEKPEKSVSDKENQAGKPVTGGGFTPGDIDDDIPFAPAK